jgi:hypothetical protein
MHMQEESDRTMCEQALRHEMDALETRLTEVVRSTHQERQNWVQREKMLDMEKDVRERKVQELELQCVSYEQKEHKWQHHLQSVTKELEAVVWERDEYVERETAWMHERDAWARQTADLTVQVNSATCMCVHTYTCMHAYVHRYIDT